MINSYVKTEWVNGQAPALNAANLNKIEQGIADVTDEANALSAGKADKATTLADYGITDAYTQAQINSLLNGKTNVQHVQMGEGSYPNVDTAIDNQTAYVCRNSGGGITGWLFFNGSAGFAAGVEVSQILFDRTGDIRYRVGKSRGSWQPIDWSEAEWKTFAKTTDLANKADKATTLAGYGITDAYTRSAIDTSLALKANTQDVGDALALKANTQDVIDALALKANTQDVAKSLKYAVVTIDPNVDAADRKLSDLENNTYSWVDSDDFSDAPVSDGSMGWIFTMKSPTSSYGMQLWVSPKNLYCYSRRCAIQNGEVAWTTWYAMTDSTLTKEGVAADAKAVGDALADIAVNYKPGAVYYSFGDSSTKGRIGTWDGSVSNSTKAYPNAVAAMLHMTLKNQAVSGQGLIGDWGRAKADKGIIEMIADLDMSDASLITVGWAYNDDYAYGVYGNPANMGNYTDVTTVDVTDTEAVKALISYSSNGNPHTYGTSVIGYYYTIMKLLQTKCPNAQIVLVTGYGHPGGSSSQQINATLIDQFTHTFTFNDGVHTVKELYDELEKMAHLHGWCCVNQAKGCAFNEFNAPYLFGDFAHPTDEGYAKYGNNLAPRIASYYANRRI